jgi:phage FluMu protein Com
VFNSLPYNTVPLTESRVSAFIKRDMSVDPKFLKEYRCPDCHKLLCKGFLNDKLSALEVKCRGCGRMCLFSGEDREIVKERSVLIKQGLIPDTDAV